MMRRFLLLGVAATGIAAGLGFFLGHSSASLAKPVSRVVPPARAAETALPPTIALSDQELTNLQLQVAKARMGPLLRAVRATGTVGYDLLRFARITPSARGRIEALDVAVGDHVVAGQRLAVLDNFRLSAARSKVVSSEAAVSEAKAQVATADAALTRAINLIRTGGMAQSELDVRRAAAVSMQAQLRTREAELRQYQEDQARLLPIGPASGDATSHGVFDSRGAITAPFAGEVDAVSVTPGELVGSSTPSFTVADLSTVWVEASIAERDLGTIKVGDAVQLHVTAFPRRIFTGHVAYIADRIDPMTGTAIVRCEIPNLDGALRVNMFAAVTILAPLHRDAVLVPSAALQRVDGHSVVFVPAGHGHFTWRSVHTGLAANGETEIASGLAAETPVVADGSYWLKAVLMQSTIPDEG